MLFNVEYKEVYGGNFEIEAESEEEAIDLFYEDFDYYSRKLWCINTTLDVEQEPENKVLWAPSDDKEEAEEVELDPSVFDVDNWF